MQCNHKDCTQKGVWQLGWKAWAFGYPKSFPPIEAYMSLAICDEHKKSTTIKDITTPDGNAIINNKLNQLGKAPLDFSKAEVIFYPIIDNKFHMPGGM